MTDTTTFAFTRGDNDIVTIRSTQIDGEPWFVGADVLRVLYGDPGSNSAVYRKLSPEETAKADRILFEDRGGKPLVLVSEPGLYKLILRSDKAEALVFQNWVTQEVLPSIRKTGKYALADHGREAMPLPMDIAEAIAVATAAPRLDPAFDTHPWSEPTQVLPQVTLRGPSGSPEGGIPPGSARRPSNKPTPLEPAYSGSPSGHPQRSLRIT